MAVTRGDVGFVLGLAGFLLGGAAFYSSFSAARSQREMEGTVNSALEFDREMLDTLVNENTANKEALAEANKRISSLRKELTDGMNDVAALRKRVEALEGR